MRARLSDEVLNIIIHLKNKGIPVVKIASVTGVHRGTIHRYLRSFELFTTTTQCTQSKINHSRRKLSDRDEQNLVRYALFHPSETMKSLAKPELCGGHKIHPTTVSRILKRHGILSRIA